MRKRGAKSGLVARAGGCFSVEVWGSGQLLDGGPEYRGST